MTNVKYFAIQTDKEIEHRRADIVVIDKEKRECKIVDIAVSGDQNIKVKELEKITKYQDLRLQVQKLWYVKATVLPIVVSALGTVSEELENHLKTIGISIVISCLQKAALLGIAVTLRRVLDISEMSRHFSRHIVVMLYQQKITIIIIIIIIIAIIIIIIKIIITEMIIIIIIIMKPLSHSAVILFCDPIDISHLNIGERLTLEIVLRYWSCK